MRVLYVDIDSLRPDHLGCYGYDRTTSPTIDDIAAEGVTFDRCYVSDSPCLPSRTALATCRHGLKNGVVTHFGEGQWYDEPGEGHQPDPDRPLSFRLLSEAGIHTMTVTSFSKRHLAYHFTAGFRESIQPTRNTGHETASDVTAAATEWLDRHAAEDDWFLHVNYWDVHHPYRSIDSQLADVRTSGDRPEWLDETILAAQQDMTGVRCVNLWPTPRSYRSNAHKTDLHAEYPMPARVNDSTDVEYLLDGYDASIRRADAAVAELLRALDSAGVREETAVVVTADHGEAFGEHGIYAEHTMAHPPCQRVPLIVSWPGLTDDAAGTHVEAFVYQFDVVPTLCERAGVEVPDGWDAKPLTAALRGESFGGRDHLVAGHGTFTFSRAIYRDDWVYIRLLHPGVFSVPGLYNDPTMSSDGLELLHDLNADPYMTENLIAERPEKATELRGLLDEWIAEQLVSSDAGGVDPLSQMAVDSGPFYYVDPEALVDLYHDLGRDATAIARVESVQRTTDGS